MVGIGVMVGVGAVVGVGCLDVDLEEFAREFAEDSLLLVMEDLSLSESGSGSPLDSLDIVSSLFELAESVVFFLLQPVEPNKIANVSDRMISFFNIFSLFYKPESV